ncbi:MAG TPA: YfhO family protein [Thermomicrobiales bacterium]|nr:YfhO family protein [Thermomicrobiales bacterium]
MSNHRTRLIPDLFGCGLLAVTIGLLFWNRATFDIWIARHDNLTAYLPWWSYLGERLAAGQIPGWNPHQFSGIPFLADPQSGWMYVPTMLAFTIFDPLNGMKAKLLIELLVAGYSTYALARLYGYSPIAAFCGAALFVFGPFSLFSAYCCTVRLHIATWIPLALLGPEIALRSRRWPGRLAGIGFGAFAYSQMLAGWLGQGTYDAALIIGAYCLYRSLTIGAIGSRFRRAATGIGIGLAVGLFGVALDAAALLPRLAFNGETHLGAGNYDQLTSGYYYNPFGLRELVGSLLNDDYRHRGFTVPAAGILLALLAVALVPRAHPVPFFAGMTLVVYGLTLDWGPPYWLLSLLPRWQELHNHYPQQVASAVMIGPAMLAAAAIDALPRLSRLRYRWDRVLIPIAVIASGMIWVASNQDFNRPLRYPLFAVIIAALLTLVVATGRLGRAWTTRVLVALALLVFIEPMGLEILDARTDGRIIAGWYDFWDPDPNLAAAARTAVLPDDPFGAGDFLQQEKAAEGPFRYVGYGGIGYPGDPSGRITYMERRAEPQIQAILVNGRAIFLGLYDAQGYNPTQLDRYVEYVTAMNGHPIDYHLAELRPGGIGSPLLDMLNVRYILVDARLSPDREDVVAITQGERPVFENKDVRVYENPAAFPHVWLVHDVRDVSRAQADALLRDRAVDFRQVALVEGNAPEVALPDPRVAESATITRYQPERIEIAVTAAADGLLVVSDTYTTGWHATVDGTSAPIYPTNLALRGIPVSQGTHTVVLTYSPPWLRPGIIISLLGHVLLLAAVAWWLHDRRSRAH